MWIQSKFKRSKSLKRDGIISEIKVPSVAGAIDKKYDLRVSKKGMEIVEGKNSIIISDEIGFHNSSEFDIVFTYDCFVLQLKKGTVYVREDEKIKEIVGKKVPVDFNGKDGYICWKSRKELFDLCNILMKNHYNLSNSSDLRTYANNVIFKVSASYTPENHSLFCLKVVDYDTSIALDKVEFKKYEKVVTVPHDYVDYEADVLKKGRGRKKQSDCTTEEEYDGYTGDNLSDTYDNGVYNDSDESEDLSESNMHEVDIFKEYASEEEEDF